MKFSQCLTSLLLFTSSIAQASQPDARTPSADDAIQTRQEELKKIEQQKPVTQRTGRLMRSAAGTKNLLATPTDATLAPTAPSCTALDGTCPDTATNPLQPSPASAVLTQEIAPVVLKATQRGKDYADPERERMKAEKKAARAKEIEEQWKAKVHEAQEKRKAKMDQNNTSAPASLKKEPVRIGATPDRSFFENGKLNPGAKKALSPEQKRYKKSVIDAAKARGRARTNASEAYKK